LNSIFCKKYKKITTNRRNVITSLKNKYKKAHYRYSQIKFGKVVIGSFFEGYKYVVFKWHRSLCNCKLVTMDFGGESWLIGSIDLYTCQYKTPKDLAMVAK